MPEQQMTDQTPCIRDARPATTGLLCERCAGNLHRWLQAIPDLHTIVMSIDICQREAVIPDESTHTKISGSPALVRLDVMALQDPLSRMGDGIIPVAPALRSWVDVYCEDHSQTTPAEWVDEMADFFMARWASILRRPWVDEFYNEIRDIHRMLSGISGAPKAIGRCQVPTCQEPLYIGATAIISCSKCGHRYVGTELLALAKAASP